MLHPHLTQWTQAINMLVTIEAIMSKHDIEPTEIGYFNSPNYDSRNPFGATNYTGYAHYPTNLSEVYLGWKVYQSSNDAQPNSPTVEVVLAFTDNPQKTPSREFKVCCDMEFRIWVMSYLDVVPDHQTDIESPLGDGFAKSWGLNIGDRENMQKIEAMFIIEEMTKFFKNRCLRDLQEKIQRTNR